MKINSQHPLPRSASVTPRDQPRATQGAERPAAQDAGPAAQTHLRQAAGDPAQDIDAARVNEIREAIRDGRLAIRPERIADALLESLQSPLPHAGDEETP